MRDKAQNLLHTLELMELGFALQRQNLRRRNPAWTEAEVERAFERWLCRADEPVPRFFEIRKR